MPGNLQFQTNLVAKIISQYPRFKSFEFKDLEICQLLEYILNTIIFQFQNSMGTKTQSFD